MNDLREIWQDFPPWLKTFLIGLALAIAAPTLTALESVNTATDWHVWAATLTSAVGLSVAHYVKDRLRITLTEALAGGGLLVAVVAFGAGYVTGPAVQQAGGSPPLVDSGDTYKITPRQPGTRFQAATLVCDPGATVLKPGDSPFMQVDGVGPTLTAQRGVESIVWASTNFTNPLAIYYQRPGVPGEEADVNDAAKRCLREKAGLR